MFIERRKDGKHYLVYSYRDRSGVKKIKRYLGKGLTEAEIEQARQRFRHEISLEGIASDVFDFTLTRNQIRLLNAYDDRIVVRRLQAEEWRLFTEQFTYNTNAIEGSKVRMDDVPAILKKKATNPEQYETKGVADAVRFIRRTEQDLSLALILKLHKLCFSGSKHFAGSLRKVEVVITDGKGKIVHAGIPAEKVAGALEELVVWYKRNRKVFRPLVMAAIMHDQFEHIHPFQDGNGRVGRLLLNFILLRNNYPPINISFEDRQEYYRCLEQYSAGKLQPTLEFLVKQYKKTMRQVTTPK